MEYVTFGKTGRTVSRLGFGGAPAGLKNYVRPYDPKNPDDRRVMIQALEKALELGITYYDTAPGYGSGESERIFGEVLHDVKDIFLATKVSMAEDDVVRKSVEQSLKNLQRDAVDLIQIHGTSYTPEDYQHIMKPGGMLETLERLKEEGLVNFIGFTTEDNNAEMYQMIRSGRFDVIQMCYNFIFQHSYEPSRPFGSILEAEEQGMGIATMRAPTSGTFQRWIKMVNPENTFDYSRALIQFVFSNSMVDVVLIGMRSAQRVIQNVEICNDLDGRISLDDVHSRYV